jgi:hypothetical protein
MIENTRCGTTNKRNKKMPMSTTSSTTEMASVLRDQTHDQPNDEPYEQRAQVDDELIRALIACRHATELGGRTS